MARLAVMTVHAMAFTASVLLHVAAAAVVGGPRSSAPVVAAASAEIPVDVEPVPVNEVRTDDPAKCDPVDPTTRQAAPPTHKHSYPVPASHDESPHDSSLVHLSLAAVPQEPLATSAPIADALSEPVRFTLPSGSTPMTVGGAPAPGPSAPGSSGSRETLPESAVSVPARLVASVAATYPHQARQAEIETDVPVQIVVDEQGRVVEASALKPSGYGLDEAAIRSVRAYRFSPASKDGHPVRVRMRWTVQFRLM